MWFKDVEIINIYSIILVYYITNGYRCKNQMITDNSRLGPGEAASHLRKSTYWYETYFGTWPDDTLLLFKRWQVTTHNCQYGFLRFLANTVGCPSNSITSWFKQTVRTRNRNSESFSAKVTKSVSDSRYELNLVVFV